MTLVLLALLAAGLGLLFTARAWPGAAVTVAALLLAWYHGGIDSPLLFGLLFVAIAALLLVTGLPPLRRALLTERLMGTMGGVLPRLGDTERVALEAGTVWWDAELFSGRPDWQRLLDTRLPTTSAEEEAFLDGPVAELCAMLDDWQVQQRRDLPPEVWAFLRERRFFGMIIPKRYGGLEFSAIGHSRVITKIASRSIAAAITVMVPNSLGPAELLLHYGTNEQRDRLLPRLATGEEIPCFALTGPEAGSDAAATQSLGIVESRDIDGATVLGMRLTWRKRYITLAPIATLIGLAFRLKDPDRLLADRLPAALTGTDGYARDGDLGITCALIPRDLPGISIGQRHDPMGIPFANGPTTGDGVFVDLDTIIGGDAGIGKGWRMLMDSLAAGRSISLPSLAVASAQLSARLVGAYATVREQFDTPIGRFEGIEEPLARIAGMTYLMTAARTLTCGAVDLGEKPSVMSAIVKAYLTDAMRGVVGDAMDIRAGAAIQRGPRNVLSRLWQAVPIGITVEGANILTRSMIIYGQGAIRCHPFVQREMAAIAAGDLDAFDTAFAAHAGSVATHATRALLLALTGSLLAGAPRTAPDTARLCRHLARLSAAFALVSDVTLATLGGALKRHEKLSGRLADALGWLLLASAVVKRHHDDGNPRADRDLLLWCGYTALYRIQEALGGVIDNLPRRPAAWLLSALCFPLGRRYRPPGDRLGGRVARLLLEERPAREALTADIFVPPPDEPGLGRLEAALALAVAVIPIETRLRDAVREGLIDRAPGIELAANGLQAGLIDADEYAQLAAADACRDEVIQVDAFDEADYLGLR